MKSLRASPSLGDEAEIRKRVLGFLARREHSAAELERKLEARGYSHEEIHSVLTRLAAEGLQSDKRYAEAWVHHRIERGYGPLRIRAELREAGVDSELAGECIEQADVDWTAKLSGLRQKKFGRKLPVDYSEQAKQSRFLQSRGFAADDIRRLFRTDE
jgi:regulatory protein